MINLEFMNLMHGLLSPIYLVKMARDYGQKVRSGNLGPAFFFPPLTHLLGLILGKGYCDTNLSICSDKVLGKESNNSRQPMHSI